MAELDPPPTRLTLEDFASLTLAWRKQAESGDRTTGLVADALESVLWHRIAISMKRQRALIAPSTPAPWWSADTQGIRQALRALWPHC